MQPQPSRIVPGRASGAEAPRRPKLPRSSRHHLGKQLGFFYDVLVAEPLPQSLLDLIGRFETALARQPSTTSSFREELLAAVPALRTFAMSLTHDAAQADDQVQDALLRAWQNQHRFQPGSHLMAWLFTILRNNFYTQYRKRRREVQDADSAAAGQLTALASQEDGLELRALWARLRDLPPPQREALLLVGAHGLTYEAAAEVMGCQVGTVKSRVSRARATLAAAMGYESGH
ncbi:hypothetical protein OPKNFCMD_5261 [Methylobacterium crusticola]|uniref:RNA polymerase sigma factor n=1 Tax=Methylobacterium crusticola TaxID=1697972 RepID=A0ABQ4R6E2_9HYPH|nr:sigma-70 family RNA polymerase sigma factor [Methylobacterium crusticola]GJD52495.1 hypothetical protein OPKNFCMD_5261 [Methylobacterium crusticola]